VRVRLLLVAAALVVALVPAAAAAPSAQEVTLKVDRFFDPACNCIRVRFSGTVSSGREGEYVTVMQQRCGARFSTALAGATTEPGGVWSAMPSTYYLHAPLVPGTFRARWKSHVSEPVPFRPPLKVSVRRDRTGGRFLVFVQAHATLRGEFLELQRLVAGQWKRLKYLRLGDRGVNYGGSYWASFRARRKGWTMRVFAPPETAAPCYSAGATPTFRS
jgi:hypothetical protein